MADGSSPYTTTVTATAGSDSASQSFTWTVGHLTLAALPDRTDVEGTSVSVPVSASDAAGDAMSYSTSGLPPGISIDTATGLLSGVLDVAASVVGPYPGFLTSLRQSRLNRPLLSFLTAAWASHETWKGSTSPFFAARKLAGDVPGGCATPAAPAPSSG